MAGSHHDAARRLLNRNFLLLWQGQFISQAGNQAFAVAMMYWLMEESGSATLMGLVMMASMLPGVLLGPLGGAVADRHSKKHIIVYSDALRGIAGLGFALMLSVVSKVNAMTISLLFAVVLFNGILGAAFQPAVSAAIPDLVPPEKVASANSMNQFSVQTAALFGQAAGGILYRFLGAPVLFAIDGASYILSAISESFIRVSGRKAWESAPRPTILADYGSDAIEGMRYVWQRSGMRNLLLAAAGINFLAMPVIVLLPFFVAQTLLEGAEWYGFLLAGMGGGSLLGYAAIAIHQISASVRPFIVAAAFLAVSVSMSVLSVVSTPVLAFALFVVLGFCTGVINIVLITLFQLGAPRRKRGRVMSLVYTMSSAVSPLGMALGGILGDATDKNISAIYLCCGISMLVMTLIAISRHSFRQFLACETA
jgi:MFS family permease